MTQTATIKITNEVTCFIKGLRGDHLKRLSDKFSAFAPNYFFNPKFKLGRWDGKVRYFHDNGKTFVYLLEEVLPELVKLGYNIEVEDTRPIQQIVPELAQPSMFQHILHPDTGEPIILRDYQITSANTLIEHGNGMVIASTGAGKTLICASICKTYAKCNLRTIVIVPDSGLIRQTKKDFVDYQLDVGEYSGKRKDLDHPVVVSTWQALKNNPTIIKQFGVVLVDEAHGAKGPILNEILVKHGADIPYRFGVTGTLPKEEADQLAIRAALGPVRFTVPAHELIERKVLSNLHIDVLQLEEDLTAQYQTYLNEHDASFGAPLKYNKFKDEYFPDYTAEKSYIHRNNCRIEFIAQHLMSLRDQKKGNTMCFVSSIPLGRKIAALIPDAICVNGQDVADADDRAAIYDMFKERDDLIVIATVNIAGTGLNIRRIFNMVMVDVGKSFIRVIQAIGRGLRTAADKDFVHISDICSDLKYSKRHLAVRTAYYDEAKYPYKKHKTQYNKVEL